MNHTGIHPHVRPSLNYLFGQPARSAARFRLAKRIVLLLALFFLVLRVLAQTPGETHQVEYGNTLFSIARAHGVSVDQLKEWNNLHDERIQAGQRLWVVPPAERSSVQTRPAAPAPPPAPVDAEPEAAPPASPPADQEPRQVEEPTVEAEPEPEFVPTETRRLTSSMRAHGLQLAGIEQRYDIYLNHMLGRYFPDGRFLTDVRVELLQRDEPLARSPIARTTPAGVVDVDLPGLPFVPDDLIRRDPATNQILYPIDPGRIPTMLDGMLQLRRIHVMIWADERFGPEDRLFIKQMAHAALKLEPQRGDQLTVIAHTFPGSVAKRVSPIIKTDDKTATLDPQVTDKTNRANLSRVPIIVALTGGLLLIIVLIILLITCRRNKCADQTA